MVDRQVTIRDVAKLAGVSPAVVSAAMSGREHNIRMSEATRLRVEQAIAETQERGPPARFAQFKKAKVMSASPAARPLSKHTAIGLRSRSASREWVSGLLSP